MTRAAGSTVCSPRFATPREPERETLGPAVGEVSRRLVAPNGGPLELMPWQQQVIDVALELDPDGSYHYDEMVLTVPRQSGKTALVMALAVHRLVVVSRKLGRQRLTYTAQQRQKARLKLERDFAIILRESRPSFREITSVRGKPQRSTEWKLSLNNGMENIQFGVGNYLQIDAPSRTGGHGDTLDVGVIDEAFAHPDDTIETGMSPSMITRRNRQLVVLSTAGDAKSKYLWRKTLAGRHACGSGHHGRTAYFEWSAPDDADPSSPETWRRCMPALGLTVMERVIEGEWEKAIRGGDDGINKFRRSYLNQWPEVPVLDDDVHSSTFDMGVWERLADPFAERGSNVVFGADVGEDRVGYLAVAWRRPDGAVQVMLADERGLSPLALGPRARQLAADWKAPVMIGGPASSLESDVKGSAVVTGPEFASAFGRFDDLLRDELVRHGNQPLLNRAVNDALTRKFGTQGERALQLVGAPTVGPFAAVLRALHGLLAVRRSTAAKPITAATKSVARGETADLTTMQF